MSNNTPTKWKVSWNAKDYDFQGIIEAFNNGSRRHISQSKGRAPMVRLPQIGDLVVVTCKKYRRLQCKIISNFNEVPNQLQYQDEFNINNNRLHATNGIHLLMEITHAYSSEIYPLNGCQKTWTRLNDQEFLESELHINMLNRKINELQLKINMADTQRIAQNHEIEQLKVTMALIMKSQEKLELKNKELEDQIKEATDRQNQRWWQRS